MLYDKPKESKNDGTNVSLIIDLEQEGPRNGVIPSREGPRSNLKLDAYALALSENLKGLMTKKKEELSKRDDKRCQEKEDTSASFIDLTKTAMEI
jgi:hypothetical protein